MLQKTAALWLLPRYAGGGLPAPVARFVRRAIDSDVEVAAAFAALNAVDAFVLKGDGLSPGLSAGQKDRMLTALFDDLDTGASDVTAAAPARSWWAPIAPFAGAAACVGLFVVAGNNGDLAARGGASAPLGVRVRCVDGGVVTDEATAGARQTGADLDCGQGSLLAFSATNLQKAERFVFVVGVSDSGERVWLPPFTSDSQARAVAAGTTDDVIDTLAPMPSDGVTLFVLLDDQAFSADDVERRLAAAARNGTPLGQLEKLPVDVQAQGRLILRLPSRQGR